MLTKVQCSGKTIGLAGDKTAGRPEALRTMTVTATAMTILRRERMRCDPRRAPNRYVRHGHRRNPACCSPPKRATRSDATASADETARSRWLCGESAADHWMVLTAAIHRHRFCLYCAGVSDWPEPVVRRHRAHLSAGKRSHEDRVGLALAPKAD